MNGYEPSTPRAALGLVAVAMATITMGALVVLPAKYDSVGTTASTLAAAKDTIKAPTEVAAGPARIDAPEEENREARVHSARATLAIQEFHKNRYPWSSRSRTNF